MKITCLYLPQYHEIPENNEWWGKGYTEWTAVKEAKKYSVKQIQPRIPLNENYYDLNLNGVSTWKWQSELANKYGVDSFCIYHYWFEGRMLLEKPMEILLENKDIDLKYTICWANESWARNWDGGFKDVLMEQTYGDEQDWKNHFSYLLPFFKDERYEKIDNKPIVHIYKSQNIGCFDEMIALWNKLAIDAGFSGVYVISAITAEGKDMIHNCIDQYYYFEPGYTLKHDFGKLSRMMYLMKSVMIRFIKKCFRKQFIDKIISTSHTWKRIENRESHKNEIKGTFVGWDNTPRRKTNGTVFLGGTPELFAKHIKKLSSGNEQLYINAWNEWGEGTYLEPDEYSGYGYLQALLERN